MTTSGESGTVATALVEPLARFLLEHDHCGDGEWVTDPHKEWYRALANDVLLFLVALNISEPEGPVERVPSVYEQLMAAHRAVASGSPQGSTNG